MTVKEVSIMRFGIDIKSFVIGVLATACVVAVLGASGSSTSNGPVNRFQIAGNPGHIFVIDSVTGQVWENFTSPTGGGNSPDFSAPKLKQKEK
jgi:hypothetical protein